MGKVVKEDVHAALSAAELAKELGVSLRHIRRLDADGKLPRPVRLGGSVRWLVAEINEWLEAGAPDRKAWEKTRERKKGKTNRRIRREKQ